MDHGQGQFGQEKKGKLPPLLHLQLSFTSPRGEILELKMYLTGQRPKAL